MWSMASTGTERLGACPALHSLTSRQCAAFPRHGAFLQRRFAAADESELRLCEQLAAQILKLAGNELDAYLGAYDFICDRQTEEELHFRRHNAYRLRTARDAAREVYQNPLYMRNYMRGLLMTQVFWANHTGSLGFYAERFLACNPPGYSLLEIGPGHGLLFSRAAADPRAGRITGWDVSSTSIAQSREALARLGIVDGYALEVRDLFDAIDTGQVFDALVFSEILEHLEEPGRALQVIRGLMRPSARLFVNVPVNSPAPDHLFLLRSPEEATAFVESQGFRIESHAFYPATNYSLAAARKHALTISVCMVARLAGSAHS
jgi:2-polyprenyl-3-methyl-5-hydroxy-6-metoxy-1,4-benzoquinol methylase